MQFEDQTPIYLQIGEVVLENVLRGRWQAGTRIPSIREMAVSVEVSPNTVTRTYGHLQERGVIEQQRGLGYFVAASGMDCARDAMLETFVNKEMPGVFRRMDLLNMKLGDLEPHWDAFHGN